MYADITNNKNMPICCIKSNIIWRQWKGGKKDIPMVAFRIAGDLVRACELWEN